MKICIITTFFPCATLALVEHLSEQGHNCNFFFLANQGRTNMETLDLDAPVEGKEIKRLSKCNDIYDYIDKDVDISIVPYFQVKNRKYLIGYIPFLKNLNIIYKMLREIEDDNYDLIYVIVNEEHDGIIARELYRRGCKNVVIAYHEVLKCHTTRPELKDVVEETVWLGYPIVCYSEHTRYTLLGLLNKRNNMSLPVIYTIYFGPFETYKRYDTSIPIISSPYILFIGSIQPYKGLSFLYESLRDYGNEIKTKIVVAGSGYDSCLEEMEKDDRYLIINRFLQDYEFANLTRHAECIVCPYVSGSQSGITHTAMVFGTPIVATRVGAFPEFIEDGKNGRLVEYGDKKGLVEAIIKSIKSSGNYIPKHLQWDNIVKSLEKLYMEQW